MLKHRRKETHIFVCEISSNYFLDLYLYYSFGNMLVYSVLLDTAIRPTPFRKHERLKDRKFLKASETSTGQQLLIQVTQIPETSHGAHIIETPSPDSCRTLQVD
jgi:hypothetical protein